MLPKPRRLKDPAAIKAARKPHCEVCGGRWCLQVHHIIYICDRCRAKIHSGEIGKDELRRQKRENRIYG